MAIEESGMSEEIVETVETTDETTSIPLSMLGGQPVEPGDVIRMEVVGVEGDSVMLKYAQPAPETGGIEAMAAEFNE